MIKRLNKRNNEPATSRGNIAEVLSKGSTKLNLLDQVLKIVQNKIKTKI